MNRIVLGIFALGLLFAVGQALQCYHCDLGVENLCITSTTTCKSGELCFSGIGTAVGFITIKQKGCLAMDECNKVTSVEITADHAIYSMNKTCCEEDLCNSAPSLPAPVLLPITMATLSASLLMSRTLV